MGQAHFHAARYLIEADVELFDTFMTVVASRPEEPKTVHIGSGFGSVLVMVVYCRGIFRSVWEYGQV
jgi:hypothetical protein